MEEEAEDGEMRWAVEELNRVKSADREILRVAHMPEAAGATP